MGGNIQRKISNVGNKSSSWHHTIRTNGIHQKSIHAISEKTF